MPRKNVVASRKLQVTIDASTEQLIGEIAAIGLHGSNNAEVACSILRMWLWDNQAKLLAVGIEFGRHSLA